MEDTILPVPTDVKLAFSRYDIFEKSYDEYETKISNPTSAVSEEELQQQEPLLLLCESCSQ